MHWFFLLVHAEYELLLKYDLVKEMRVGNGMFSFHTRNLMQIIKSTSKKSVQKDLIILAKCIFHIELQKLPFISIMYTF